MALGVYVVLPAGSGARRVRAIGQITPSDAAWSGLDVVELTAAQVAAAPAKLTWNASGVCDYTFDADTGAWVYDPQ